MPRKRYTFLVLCVALLLLQQTGLASGMINITQLREQLPIHWVQEYQAHGRSISINVQPSVPHVDAISIVRVKQDISVPDTSKLGSDSQSRVGNDGIFYIEIGDPNGVEKQATEASASNNYYPPFDFDKAYAQNNPITLREAIEYVEETMTAVDYGQWNLGKPRRLLTSIVTENRDNEPIPPGNYTLFFSQQLNGVPILNHARFGIEKPKGEPPFIWAQLGYQFRTLDDVSISGEKVRLEEVIADDVPLVSFSAVQKSIEQEILAGHIRRVFDVELGYVLYNQAGAMWQEKNAFKMSFYAVPIWVVNCYYIEDPTKELRDYSEVEVPERGVLEYKQVYINAQTGRVVDRSNNLIGASDYTGYISWKDIGGEP